MPAMTIEAGRPSSVWLHAPFPIPPDTALTLWLRGPKTLRGVVAEREAPTVNIEARFAVRVAGEYTLTVEEKERIFLDALQVSPRHNMCSKTSCAGLAYFCRYRFLISSASRPGFSWPAVAIIIDIISLTCITFSF